MCFEEGVVVVVLGSVHRGLSAPPRELRLELSPGLTDQAIVQICMAGHDRAELLIHYVLVRGVVALVDHRVSAGSEQVGGLP